MIKFLGVALIIIGVVFVVLSITLFFACESVTNTQMKIDKPYIQANIDVPHLPVLRGLATYYTTRECKNKTASMEVLDDAKLTCACWLFDFGTMLRVENIKTGKFVIVRLNDRGPNRRFQDRIIDLSEAAFKVIGNLKMGKVEVKITVEENKLCIAKP